MFRTLCLILLAPAIAVVVAVAGRVDRTRVNVACEWTSDPAFPIDLQKPSDRQHLIIDAQLAEDLAGRYADVEHGRLTGFAGHGGLIDNGRLVRECMARLSTIIEHAHGVASADLLEARRQRNRWFDMGVWLSFLPAYWFAASSVFSWIYRRFSAGQSYLILALTGLAALVVSFLGVQFGDMWSTTAEMFRVGNDHIGGHRGAYPPWGHHIGDLYVAGVLLFWLIALVKFLRTSPADDPTTNVMQPQGLVLR